MKWVRNCTPCTPPALNRKVSLKNQPAIGTNNTICFEQTLIGYISNFDAKNVKACTVISLIV